MPNAQYTFKPAGGATRVSFPFSYVPNTGQINVFKNQQHVIVPYDYVEPAPTYIDFVSPFMQGDVVLVQLYTTIPANRPEVFNIAVSTTQIVLARIRYTLDRDELHITKNGATLNVDDDFIERTIDSFDLKSPAIAGDRIVVRSLRHQAIGNTGLTPTQFSRIDEVPTIRLRN